MGRVGWHAQLRFLQRLGAELSNVLQGAARRLPRPSRNTPNLELSDFTPLQVIEKGKADAVADMVSSALLGQPA
jgi:hypothetical protein